MEVKVTGTRVNQSTGDVKGGGGSVRRRKWPHRAEKSQELGCEGLAISLCLTLYKMGNPQQYLRENDIIKFAFYLPVLNEKETQQNWTKLIEKSQRKQTRQVRPSVQGIHPGPLWTNCNIQQLWAFAVKTSWQFQKCWVASFRGPLPLKTLVHLACTFL